jgi:hypothetical protein
MEIHLSLGVSTIVALMAAHRDRQRREMPAAMDRTFLEILRGEPGTDGLIDTRDGNAHPVS